MPDIEKIDHIPNDPAATAWRRAARRHQNNWRVANGWPPGQQRRSAQQGGGSRPIGSRIDADFGRTSGVNFLSDAPRRAVAHRLANPERHETLDTTRLFSDLLSSMPMCFNLFGPLWDDPALASNVVHRWFPDLCPPGARVAVNFEWSPGRADDRWLGDRTAFDVALHIDTGKARHLIGIETKYHEYPLTPRAGRPRRQRYLDIATRADMFCHSDEAERVWGSDLEQIWRDHLLALACQQEGAFSAVRYILVAPEMNAPWSDLSRRYTESLEVSARSTFAFLTVEALLEAAGDVPIGAETFRSRYLAV